MVGEIYLQVRWASSENGAHDVTMLHACVELIVHGLRVPPLGLSPTDSSVLTLHELMESRETGVLVFLVDALKGAITVLECKHLPCALSTSRVAIGIHESTVLCTKARSCIAVFDSPKFSLHHLTSNVHESLIHVDSVTAYGGGLQQHASQRLSTCSHKVGLASRVT